MAFEDVELAFNDNCFYDISLENDDIKDEIGLETAVIISLFTDARVLESELPAGQTDRRGWWGDMFPDIKDDQIGSKLWLFDRGKLVPGLLVAYEDFSTRALAWLVDDGVATTVDASAEFNDFGFLLLAIDIARPNKRNANFDFIWDGQKIKRG